MRSRGKIKPSALAVPGAIRPTSLPPVRLSFSFKYLQFGHKKFQFENQTPAYFVKLLDRLKHICELSWLEMCTTHKESLKCHDHKWHMTSEPNGFGLKGQLADCKGWQFQLTANEYGRVHGFSLNEVFYVVWLDPGHQLYP